MRRFCSIVIFLSSCLNPALAQKETVKSIAFSFDDAPMGNSQLYTGKERTQRLTSILAKHKIIAVFFSNSSKFNSDDGLQRMQAYDKAGHYIANHTHSHPHLTKLSVNQYKKEIKATDTKLKQFKNYKKWFRYPYLDHGDTLKKRDDIRSYLQELGYLHGYVTINNQDWYMSSILDENIKKGLIFDKAKLCKSYSQMIFDAIKLTSQASEKYLKNNPKHMLLLHENDIAALCLEELISLIRKNNWTIISPQQAMTDPIYSLHPKTLFSANGIIAAVIHEKTGDYISHPWHDLHAIKDELSTLFYIKTKK